MIVATILNPVTTPQVSISLTNPWTQPSRASFYFYQELFPLCSLDCIPSLLSKLCDLQNNNCEKEEENEFHFRPLSLVCRAKYQGRTYLCSGGLVKSYNFYQISYSKEI